MTVKERYIDPRDLPETPVFPEGISLRFIRENQIIPIEQKDNVLKVVMERSGDRALIDALKMASSAEIEVYVTDAEAIKSYIANNYGQTRQEIGRIIEEMDEEGPQRAKLDDEDVSHLMDLASEAPIIKLVNTLLNRAVKNRASDIHIEPFEDELKVRYRIDGVLHEIESIPKRLQPAILSRIKLTAKLNIAERRLPQDGRILIREDGRDIDIRVSSVPVIHGESLVMRILDKKGMLMDLESLGFSSVMLEGFKSLIKRPNGIILVTGPTGSGKTTALYAALQLINAPDKKIITVEDPVEYQIDGINQIQVNPKIDLTFANILRHIVRQDPDIIMIGEIRDLETGEIAIQSALTGHLVFSTLHTNDAPSAVTRLIDMGLENYLLSSTVRGILAQRLVRVICPECKEADETLKGDSHLPGIDGTTPLYRGKGCRICGNTGYFGRTGIFELLTLDDEMCRLILKNVDSVRMRKEAVKRGMTTLLEDGAEKVRAGITTVEEVLRVTQE